jgi:hypothetical protein
MASATEDPQVRAALLQMAQTWYRLADDGRPDGERNARE